MSKESFLIRTEWMNAIFELEIPEQAVIFKNLFYYHSNNENLINLTNLSVKLVWKLIEPNLKRNVEYYDKRVLSSKENGKKGGRPKKTENLNKPNKPTKPDTDSDTDSVSDIVSDNNKKEETQNNPNNPTVFKEPKIEIKHILQKHIKNDLKNVSQLKYQLTEIEAEQICIDYPDRTFVKKILNGMENYDLTKKTSVNLTFREWAEREKSHSNNGQTSEYVLPFRASGTTIKKG